MLPVALQLGVPLGTFWELSLDEIEEIFDAESEKLKQQRKEKIILLYELADAIGNRVAKVFGGKDVTLIQAEQVHPELFDIEKADERTRIGEMQAETRRQFASKWNPILRQKHGLTQTTSNNRSEYEEPEKGNGGSESGSKECDSPNEQGLGEKSVCNSSES